MAIFHAPPEDRSRLWFALAIAAVALMALAFPLWQAVQPLHLVYSLNGIDEYTYLQYEFSRSVQAATRPGQYLVTLGHELGLSGGWLNVVYDLATLVAFPLLCRAIFRRLGWSAGRAAFAGVGMVLLPLFFTATNPLIAELRNRNVASGMIYWLNSPEIFSPAILRSPEPQFSLLLLAAVTLVALRWRTFWPVYPAILFMYPFVALPAGFVTLALHLRARWPFASRSVAGPLLASYLAVSVGAGLYNNLLVPAATRTFLLASRLPLISLTSTTALLVLAFTWRRIEASWRFPTLAIALAPMVACNMQLVSGVIVHPDNFEQYVGCFVVAIVLLVAFAERPRVRWALLALGALLFARSAYVSYRVNQAHVAQRPLTPALIDALRHDPDHTVIDEVVVASLLSMLWPKQPLTALAYQKTYVVLADKYAPSYRCLKARLMRERPGDPAIAEAFTVLDPAYRFASQDFIFVNLGRKHDFKELQDVRPEACDLPADPAPLRVFHVER